jgi:E3 ubiquitin-protein ligase TRIP12
MAQKQPNDWHLVFEVGGQPVSLDSTIYRAIHNFEMTPERQTTGLHRHIWNNVYTVKFRRVDGPAPAPAAGEFRAQARLGHTADLRTAAATPEPEDASSSAVVLPSSVAEDASFAKILQLLSVLHELNAEWRQDPARSESAGVAALSEAAFVNNKLTAKLNRQLEEPLVVASACLPDWALELPKTFPFLFPFEARYSFLQNTAFDCPRLIARWQTQQSRNQDPSSAAAASRTDDARAVVGRLSRQKVRIGRQNIFGSALKVFELYGSSSALLEIEYFDEVGTGLGPTLEFYALVSKEFARKDLGLWRDDGAGAADSRFVSAKQGLFPAVADAATRAAAQTPESEAAKTNLRLQSFVVLGQFVAKALLDSRIIDVHFSSVFLRAALLNGRVPETLATLAQVDAALARSMQQLLAMPPADVEALGLDFTLPGRAEYELHAGGASETVTGATVQQYVAEVLSHTLVQGVRPYVRAFRRGFNGILPLGSMASFSADELVLLFGNTDEDWSEATLLAAIKPDHGFTGDSLAFRDVVALMAAFSLDERRRFLQWLTGSPKLPIGGLAGLHPQLTIVKRPHEAPLTPDDYLPSVMTCVNYLKLPAYSSRDVMRRRLETAMREGGTSFHLS